MPELFALRLCDDWPKTQPRMKPKKFKEASMSSTHLLVGAERSPSGLSVRRITPADLAHALASGWDDFDAMPSHAVFLCLIYPLLGLGLVLLCAEYSMLPLAFPLAAGFALIGPFAAVGLYELSRRREAGLDTNPTHAFDVLHSPSLGAILALGLLLVAIFVVWLAVAEAIYVANFGYAAPASIPQFVKDVFTTSAGWTLIVVGTGVGFLFAVVALMIGAVSFPLLLDRDVGSAVALLTSIRVVVANPLTMALWGLIVAALLVLGSLPFFLGLTVVMPVLGHATWHLYRRAIEPGDAPRVDIQPSVFVRAPRSAADFPASLFPTRVRDGSGPDLA
jgi:uncharacterized membrane protein